MKKCGRCKKSVPNGDIITCPACAKLVCPLCWILDQDNVIGLEYDRATQGFTQEQLDEIDGWCRACTIGDL